MLEYFQIYFLANKITICINFHDKKDVLDKVVTNTIKLVVYMRVMNIIDENISKTMTITIIESFDFASPLELYKLQT